MVAVEDALVHEPHYLSGGKLVMFCVSEEMTLQALERCENADIIVDFKDENDFHNKLRFVSANIDDSRIFVSLFSQFFSLIYTLAINDANPNLLWISRTAPKQEKGTYSHWDELDIHCHVGTMGAVFDFFAGIYQRAPQWWQDHSLEWLYRLMKEPKRMWRRYVIGNPLSVWNVMKEDSIIFV